MQQPYFARFHAHRMASMLTKPFVHILFGARQTGKTFLLRHLIPNATRWYNFADPSEKARHTLDAGAFIRECQALPQETTPATIVVDEAQAVPSVFDAIQVLYDSDKYRWRFVLCGSSAWKLRVTGANLLPGRSILHHLYPLVLCERPPQSAKADPVILPLPGAAEPGIPSFPGANIEERLAFGELPGIALADEEDRGIVLRSYAAIYLEEEIRRETTLRNWNAFVKFLNLAATHSGQMVNFASLSRETGTTISTIKSHYQLLEDIFVGFSIPGYTKSTRKSLLSTPRFFFVDIGLRHAAAGLDPDRNLIAANPGSWFEQWVGIELWKRLQYLGKGKLSYLRAKSGMEIDFILELENETIPIEVKWTETPSSSDARHIRAFLDEIPDASRGYIVCRCPYPQAITSRITAIPWWMI